MPVEVVDETAAGEEALAAVAAAVAEALLDCLGRADDELCVALVGDDRIRELNRDWRGKDKATDVLSFSQVEGGDFPEAGEEAFPEGDFEDALDDDPGDDSGDADAGDDGSFGGAFDEDGAAEDALEDAVDGVPVMLGDVVVSVDTLRRQAADGGWTDAEELARLLLHGTLHLLGHDHEHDDEARAMRAEEARLVGLLAQRGIAVAWEDDAP